MHDTCVSMFSFSSTNLVYLSSPPSHCDVCQPPAHHTLKCESRVSDSYGRRKTKPAPKLALSSARAHHRLHYCVSQPVTSAHPVPGMHGSSALLSTDHASSMMPNNTCLPQSRASPGTHGVCAWPSGVAAAHGQHRQASRSVHATHSQQAATVAE